MTACPQSCPESRRPLWERDWVITQRQRNRSAFGGYAFQSSTYSEVACQRCGATWRPKAAYVARLKDKPRIATRR